MYALPEKLPAVLGVNEIETETVWRGDTVMGRLGPTKRKPVPETVTFVIVTLDLPVFVMATGWTIVLPTCTVPKLAGFAAREAWARVAFATEKRKSNGRVQKAGLRKDPREIIFVRSLFARAS